MRRLFLTVFGVCALFSLVLYAKGDLTNEIGLENKANEVGNQHSKLDIKDQGMSPNNQSKFLKHRGLRSHHFTESNSESGRNLANYEILDGLMNSDTFEEHFFNATHESGQNTNWNTEGILVALSSDKPVYKTGDIAEIRAFFYNMTTKEPVDCSVVNSNFKIFDSQDQEIFTVEYDWQTPCEGISQLFEYEVPEDQSGGVYFAKLSSWNTPDSILKLRIRDYQSTNIVKVDYSRESYAPGDLVSGKLTYESIDNEEIPDDSYFEITTSVGHDLSNFAINSAGSGFFDFQIPMDLEDSHIFVTFTLHVGAETSTKSDVIVIVQKDNLVIEYTGESGRIVHSLLNRVYFECWSGESRTEHVDVLNANLIQSYNDENDEYIMSSISTIFNGRGYFDFVPRQSYTYYLEYKGVKHKLDISEYNQQFENSETDSNAEIIIKSRSSVFESDGQIELIISKAYPDEEVEYMLVISQRKHVLYAEPVTLTNVDTWVTIDVSDLRLLNGGVVSISLFDVRQTVIRDENVDYFYYTVLEHFGYQTVASRLAYILPDETLDINVVTDQEVYSPGQTVTYSITVTDKATGNPVEDDVYVSLSVTDLSAFLQVDNIRQPASLLSKAFLEKDIRLTDDFEFLNANEFSISTLDTSQSESITKLSLLLGTQKWRLFLEDPIYRSTESSRIYPPSESLSDIHDSYRLTNLWGLGTIYDIMEDFEDDFDMAQGEAGGVPVPETAPNEDQSENEGSAVVIEDDYDDTVDRTDFKETQLFTDFLQISNGQYSSSFDLGDLITKFQFTVDAVSNKGVYGALTSTFVSNKEFYIEATMPQFLTSNDVIEVPLLVRNNFAESITASITVSTDLENGELSIDISDEEVTLLPLSSQSIILTLSATQPTSEEFSISVSADCGTDCSDSFTKQSRIIGRGFPVNHAKSGFIGMNDDTFITEATLDIELSDTYEPGTFEATAKVFTTQLSHIHESLGGLIREPYGCFEQTSSTTYPMVMALQIMLNAPDKTEEIHEMIMDGTKKLQTGYTRLLTFETSEGGFEWFGTPPGHETLTAYGLMQFHEMKQVLSDVDDQMIQRVTEWLLRRRDGSGSFRTADNGLDSFARPPNKLADAYIIYALTTIGQTEGLEVEINALKAKAENEEDTYFGALVASILYNVGDVSTAREISRKLASHQDSAGVVGNSETSITRSSGPSLEIETTALCTLAWLKDPGSEFVSNIESSVNYIVSSVEDGYYRSTQGTILSLKVLIEFLENSRLEGTGTFELTLDDTIIQSYLFDSQTNIATLDFTGDLETYLKANQNLFLAAGSHSLTLELKDFDGDESEFRIAYAMQVTVKDLSPLSNPDSNLEFTLTSSTSSSPSTVGDITTYNIQIQNTDSTSGKGMLTSIIRIPSCLQIDFNWLESLLRTNQIAYFEVLNDNTDVILYWRSMDPDETKSVDIQMSQVYDYTTCIYRPSKAYLYYDQAGSVVWTD